MLRTRPLARRALWALLAGLFVAHAASAQPDRPAPDLDARIDRIASDLALDADQRAALDAVAARYASPEPGALWSAAADVEAVLTDAQVDRLREQMQARRAERREARAERADGQPGRRDRARRGRSWRERDGEGRPAARLTDEQRRALRDLSAEIGPRAEALVESFRRGTLSDEAFVDDVRALREEAVSQLQDLLPPKAQERLAEEADRHRAVRSARADALGLTAEQQEAFQALALDRLRSAPGWERHASGERPGREEREQMREQMCAQREAARARRQEARAEADAILTDDQQDVIAIHRALATRPDGARDGRGARHGGHGMLIRLLGPLGALDPAAETDAASAPLRIVDVPAALAVEAVVPNPGADRVRVLYALPETGAARVEVFDVQGRRVALLADGARSAGPHEATLDASALSPGVYVVRVVVGGAQAERSFTIAR